MRRYFFDLRDDDLLTLDEEGMHLATVEAVQHEAARSRHEGSICFGRGALSELEPSLLQGSISLFLVFSSPSAAR